MIVFIISMVCCLIGIGSAFLSYTLFTLISLLMFVLSRFFMIAAIAFVFIFKNKKDKILSLISVLLLLLFIIYGEKFTVFIHERHEVKKYLDDKFANNYKIKGVHDDKYKKSNEYNFSFDVEVNDKYNTNFVAMYTDTGSGLPHLEVVTDYVINYVSNYYNEYKKSNNVKFDLNHKYNYFEIVYNSSDRNDVVEFINNSFDSINKERFCIYLIEDGDNIGSVCSWNRDYPFSH